MKKTKARAIDVAALSDIDAIHAAILKTNFTTEITEITEQDKEWFVCFSPCSPCSPW